MKAFFLGLLNAALQSAAQGVVTAGNQNVTDPKTVGMAAGASAIAGTSGYALSWIFTHPLGQHPAVAASVAAVKANTEA
jgi:hypothetical protein